MLLFDGCGQITLLECFGCLGCCFCCVGFLFLGRLFGQLLLKFCQVRSLIHRLLQLGVRLLRFHLGLVQLLDCLGNLLGSVGRVDLIRLKGRLIRDLFRIQLVELLLNSILRRFQILRGLFCFLSCGHRLVLVELVLGHLLVLGRVLDLLARLGNRVLHLLANVLGWWGELLLLLG